MWKGKQSEKERKGKEIPLKFSLFIKISTNFYLKAVHRVWYSTAKAEYACKAQWLLWTERQKYEKVTVMEKKMEWLQALCSEINKEIILERLFFSSLC